VADLSQEPGVVRVSRPIAAPASTIFAVLSDPARHPDFDGSGMLRSSPENRPITGVGDVFVMKMCYEALGDYETNNHVVAFEAARRIAWEPAPRHTRPAAAAGVEIGDRVGHRWGFELSPQDAHNTVVTEVYDCRGANETVRSTVHEGRSWRRSMEQTLERLDALVAVKGA
jgi:uncharacterized protein YndB with AHSA1/START domain